MWIFFFLIVWEDLADDGFSEVAQGSDASSTTGCSSVAD